MSAAFFVLSKPSPNYHILCARIQHIRMPYLNIMHRGGDAGMSHTPSGAPGNTPSDTLEGFLLLNACMNAALLCVTLRWSGERIVAWRVALAAVFGALYAAAAYLPGLSWLRALPCAALVCAAMLWTAARWRKAVHLLRALALLLCATFLMGGTVYAISQALGGAALYWRLGATAMICLAVVLGRCARRIRLARIQVRVRLGEACAELAGLIDSGNLLCDAISGLPVVIAPYTAIRALLPDSCDPARLETLPPGFRLVRAVSTGGSRTLMCFRPGAISLREAEKWRKVCAMVAVAPQALPEGELALIPAALIAT